MDKWYKQPLMRRYIMSFLCVGLIPVIALGLTLCVSQYTSRKAALHEELYGKVESISAYYETLITKIETIAAHYSSNYFSEQGQTTNPQQQLVTYRKSHALQGNLFLYDRGMPYMDAEDIRMEYAEFEKKYPFGNELNRISFYTMINSLTTSRYTSTLGFDDQSNFYACIVPIPYLDANPSQTLIYFESIAEIRDSIINYLGDFTGYFCIQDSEYRVSYILDAYGMMDVEDLRYKVMSLTGTPIVWHEMNNESFVSFRVPSARLGFTYVLSIPQQALYADLNRTITLYIVAMSVLFAAVLVLTIMLSRRLFEPIHSLEQELSIDDEEDEESRSRQDIFEAIRKHYQTVRDQNDRLVMQLQSNTQSVRTKLLSDLLGGRITGEGQLTNALRAISVQFEHHHFSVIVFRLHSLSPLDDPAGSAAEYLQEMRFAAGQAYGAETGDPGRFGVIVNRRGLTDDEEEDEVRLALARLFQTQLQDFGFQVLCAGVSACHHSPLRLNQCLIEAYTAIAEDASGIQLYREPAREAGDQTFEDGEMLRQCLLIGDAEVAIKTISRLTDGMQLENLPVSLRQARFFQISNTISAAAARVEYPLDTVALSISAAEADPERFVSAAKIAIRALCSDMEAQKEQKRADFSSSVIDYLYDHFADNLLTAVSVAEHFGISESMLRRVVKEATGTSFANYVTTLRFAQIKSKLAETNLPIKDIVEGAGYMDVSSFTRKFKSTEGVTPGQYRAMLRQEVAAPEENA